jgi:hypothetical protein
MNQYVHTANNLATGLHDIRLRAVQQQTLRVAGIVLYHENAGQDIEQLPGSTYVDKTKITIVDGASFAIPSVDGTVGGKVVSFKTEQSAYGITTLSLGALTTVGVGSSGTNSISVSTGSGASYAIGMGFQSSFGTSQYVGTITNISTDTLTVGPTLAFGVSGALSRAWYAGATVAINASFFQLSYSFDPAFANYPVDPQGFGASSTGDFVYQDPFGRYRAWGDQLQYTSIDGTPVVAFNGATVGFFQVDGRFSAAEVEWYSIGSSSVLHGTFSINGVPSWGQNQGFTATLKQTVFTDAGPGWNSFNFGVGASFFSVGIAKINFYESKAPLGPTFGRLAELPIGISYVSRGTHNATLMPLGQMQRWYADQLYLRGPWTRGATTSVPGGILYTGLTTTCRFDAQWYGGTFSIMGAGASYAVQLGGVTLTGASLGIGIGTTLAFNNVRVDNLGTTLQIAAFDFLRPTVGAPTSVQKYVPRVELLEIPKIFQQGRTPQNAKDGDMWVQNPQTANFAPAFWVKAFGNWMQFSVVSVSDDPEMGLLINAGGSPNGTFANAVATAEQVTLFSVLTIPNMPAARMAAATGDSAQPGTFMYHGGVDVASAASAVTYLYRSGAWSTSTSLPGARAAHGGSRCFGFTWNASGLTDPNNGGTVQTSCFSFNGSSWATRTVWGTATAGSGYYFDGTFFRKISGNNSSSSEVSTHETRNAADAVGSSTAFTIGSFNYGASAAGAGGANGMLACAVAGAADGTNSYRFSGSAFSSAIAYPVSRSAIKNGAQFNQAGRSVFIGGTTGGTGTGTIVNWNDVSFVQQSVVLGRNACLTSSGVI